jgi:isoleucyl-tRNA synthetase
LLEAVVHYPGQHERLRPLLDLIAEELNVKRVLLAESNDRFGRFRAKPDFKVLGPRLGGQVKSLADALAADDGTLADALARGESVTVATPTGDVALHPNEVDLLRETLVGWGVATDGGLTVALELELTDELRLEGAARELIRLVQDARKAAGLQVSDRIDLGIETSGDLASALAAHRALVTGETLATSLSDGPVPDPSYRHEAEIDGVPISITLARRA